MDRKIKQRSEITLVDNQGNACEVAYQEPMADVYRAVQRNSYNLTADGTSFTSDMGKTIDDLYPIAQASLLELKTDVTVTTEGGLRFKIDAGMSVPSFNQQTGQLFRSWQEIFGAYYPDWVYALAQVFFTKLSTFAGVPRPQLSVIEKNSGRTSGESSSPAGVQDAG